jgi:hypothetical protein
MADERVIKQKLRDVLPEFGQMIAKDFNHFRDDWLETFNAYVDIFERLRKILSWNVDDVEKSAVEVIEEFIKNRSRPTEEWVSPDWLAYELGRILYELMEGVEMGTCTPEKKEEPKTYLP